MLQINLKLFQQLALRGKILSVIKLKRRNCACLKIRQENVFLHYRTYSNSLFLSERDMKLTSAGSAGCRNCPLALLRRLHRCKIELVRQCILGRANIGRMQGGISC
jgi:hypothetical protein